MYEGATARDRGASRQNLKSAKSFNMFAAHEGAASNAQLKMEERSRRWQLATQALQRFSDPPSDRVLPNVSTGMTQLSYPTLSSSFPNVGASVRRLADAARANPLLAAGAAVAIGLAATAVVNRSAARRAERANPPLGRFLNIDGLRLHYLEHGQGDPLVLLHGNGSMIEDFASSGLMDLAARDHRVIVFDRPGFGHSDRPRSRVWTADLQADLIQQALQRLNIHRAIVLGHSWGASVAVALALRHPATVKGLVLASGYYYPGPRVDALMLSSPAVPLIGDVIRTTVAPLVARLIWPRLLRKIFGPRPVPAKFAAFPREMALRPSQIRASAEEAALMLPAAALHENKYASLQMPVVIIAGEKDQVIETNQQSARLHRDIAESEFTCVPGQGHMIQQTATAAMMTAIKKVEAISGLNVSKAATSS